MSADMMYATAHVHDPDDSYLVLPKIYGGGKVVRIDKARQEETEELHALGQPSYIDVYCTEDQVVPEPKLLSAP